MSRCGTVTAMSGSVCLQGGGEFSPGCREMDAALLAAADGPVVVSALAGEMGRDYQTATANGVRHLRSLGGQDVSAAPDVREDRTAGLDVLRTARLLVLPGGSPSRLLSALTGAGVDQLLADLLAAGGAVMGASAGAMVLCGWTVLPDRGRPQVVRGLGLVEDVVVLPHWSPGSSAAGWQGAVEAAVPVGVQVLGLPEESGVVVQDGRLTAVGQRPSRLVTCGVDLAVGSTWSAA